MPYRPEPSPAHEDTLSTLKRLYTDHDYSDLCLTARIEYPLHCVLVCTGSPVLKAALQYNATNSTPHRDSPKARLDLTGDDHWAVDCMVQYFYLQDYARPSTANEAAALDPLSPWPHNLIVHTRVFGLAEQYGITSLKDVALAKFTDEVEYGWRSPEFAQAANEVYNSTVDTVPELRRVVVQTLSSHRYDLKGREDIEELFLMNPQLGYFYINY